MLRNDLLSLLIPAFLCGLLLASPAWADEDDDLEDDLLDEDLEDEDLDPEMDDEETYEAYKEELRGESPSEELEAWERYLEVYPKSLYRIQIEARMSALEDAAFEELQGDPATEEGTGTEVDAKRREMNVYEPTLTGMNPNTRRRFEFGLLWGYNDYLNYELSVEWAFRRQFSLFGGIRHEGRSFGGALQAGVKYAMIKDVRTGVVLTGAFSIKVGYSSLDRLSFTIEPWIGFAWLASDIVQVQTSLAIDFRPDRLLHWVTWDAMVVVKPNPKVGIYIESKQKHSLHDVDGLETQYLAFFQAGIGAKFHPTDKIELSVGANIPYFWRLWKDYNYVGIHADAVFFFGGTPDK